MLGRPIVGQNNPDGIELQEGKDTVPFTPHATVKDIFGTVCFLILHAWYNPNYLGHSDNYIPANPSVTPASVAQAALGDPVNSNRSDHDHAWNRLAIGFPLRHPADRKRAA
jgi:hypothetical protein